MAQVDSLRDAGYPVSRDGYLALSAATKLFDWADFVLLPSRIESIPVVFSDAMQAGRPLICTPVGDLPRLMSRYRCGVMAEQVTATGIADAIRKALHQGPAEMLVGLGEAADDFDVGSTAARVVDLLGRESDAS